MRFSLGTVDQNSNWQVNPNLQRLISPNARARALQRNSGYGATIIFQSIVGSLPTYLAFDGYWRSTGAGTMSARQLAAGGDHS